MSILETERGEAIAQTVSISDDSLKVDLADGRTITVPLAWFPRLIHGTQPERSNFRFIGNGSGLHWPDLDEDISVQSLLAGRRSGELPDSLKKWQKPMDPNIIHQVMTETQAGKLIFPEVVRRLIEAGVESYFVDLAAGHEAFYLADGRTHTEPLTLPPHPVAADFSHSDVVRAILAAQSDTIRYPEFMQRAAAAGVCAYWAFLTGQKVIYFGRKGEMHMEAFPRSNQATSSRTQSTDRTSPAAPPRSSPVL